MGYSWTIHQYIHKNDGSGDVSHYSNSGTASVPQGSGYSVNITVHSNPYTRDGYDFLGYTRGSGGTTLYQPGEGYTVSFSAGNGSKDLNWYCKWAIKKYAVSFNGNGGTNVPAAQTKTHGVSLALSGTRPVKSGYRFVEWNTKADGTGTSYAAGAAYSENDEVTLYAQWTKSGEATASIPLPTPVLEGHVFQGWTIDPEAETGMTGRYTPERNTTLYALWTIGTYTITFDMDGGTEIAPITGKFGSVVTAPENPTKPGYAFKGWDKAIPETMPGEDMTIKALYEAQPFGEADFILPAFLTEIEEEAFEGAAMTSVYVPDTCTVIGANAFKDCTQLEKVRLPQDCEIDDTVFNGCKDPAVYAPAGGSTEKWCKAQGISFLPEAAE